MNKLSIYFILIIALISGLAKANNSNLDKEEVLMNAVVTKLLIDGIHVSPDSISRDSNGLMTSIIFKKVSTISENGYLLTPTCTAVVKHWNEPFTTQTEISFNKTETKLQGFYIAWKANGIHKVDGLDYTFNQDNMVIEIKDYWIVHRKTKGYYSDTEHLTYNSDKKIIKREVQRTYGKGKSSSNVKPTNTQLVEKYTYTWSNKQNDIALEHNEFEYKYDKKEQIEKLKGSYIFYRTEMDLSITLDSRQLYSSGEIAWHAKQEFRKNKLYVTTSETKGSNIPDSTYYIYDPATKFISQTLSTFYKNKDLVRKEVYVFKYVKIEGQENTEYIQDKYNRTYISTRYNADDEAISQSNGLKMRTMQNGSWGSWNVVGY